MMAVTPGGSSSADDPRRPPRRRWLTAVVVALLIAVPMGYLVISAQQSRDSGKVKQRIAAAEGLIHRWPSHTQRQIYDVPVPPGATAVAFRETNSWSRSSLYVQFDTSPAGLDSFLTGVGTDRDALRSGRVTITERQAAEVGWTLRPGRRYAGTVRRQPTSDPDLSLTVDFARAGQPRVYLVSTTDF